MKKINLIMLTVTVLFLSSCATSRNERFMQLDEYHRNQDYNAAVAVYEDYDQLDFLYSESKDLVIYNLDKGMLNHYAGNTQAAIQAFEEAERLIEEYFTKSVTQAAGSYLLNDTVIEYSGEVFEDLYLNIFKAINYIKEEDFDGAYVEVRRMTDKLNLLTDKYRDLAEEYNRSEDGELQIQVEESKFYNSALSRYLSMIIYRADGNPDSARIDHEQIRKAFITQSHIYDFPQPDLSGYLDYTDKARLNLIGFSGIAPVKKANTLYVKNLDNQVAIVLQKENPDGTKTTTQVDTLYWPGLNSDLFFKFELPYMEKKGTKVTSIRVLVNGEAAGELELIESLENVAFETYKLKEPIIYIKTITRAIVKGLIAEEAKKAAKKEAEERMNGLAGLITGLVVEVAADAAVDASEKADTRSSRYFPSHAFVEEILLEPGVYDITLEYLGKNGVLARQEYPAQEVTKSGLNTLSSYLPR